MNPILQLELWHLIVVSTVCLGFGFCFGVLVMSLAAMASRSKGSGDV